MMINTFSRYLFLLTFILSTAIAKAQTTTKADRLCGKWISAEKNLIVEVYRDNNEFRAKIVWYKNDDQSKSMEEWTDKHNPDKSLRNRKILGMNVVDNLVYNARSDSWEHGTIYDAKTGHYWDASARLTNDGLLKVTGYWHLKFIGRSMTFKKAS